MTTPIVLPKLGFSMTEGSLVEWLVPDGAQVREGQAIYTIEDNKAVEEVEAPATGTLKILQQPGETLPIGALLGEIS